MKVGDALKRAFKGKGKKKKSPAAADGSGEDDAGSSENTDDDEEEPETTKVPKPLSARDKLHRDLVNSMRRNLSELLFVHWFNI